MFLGTGGFIGHVSERLRIALLTLKPGNFRGVHEYEKNRAVFTDCPVERYHQELVRKESCFEEAPHNGHDQLSHPTAVIVYVARRTTRSAESKAQRSTEG